MSRLFQFRQLKPNLARITVGNIVIITSYDTPVAITTPDGRRYRTDREFSQTTSRHIKAAGYADAAPRDHDLLQDVIDTCLAAGVIDD